MFLFDIRNLTFALKAFGASMMALYIAFALDLPHPSWSMLTVFIVAQPLAGMVQSKARTASWGPSPARSSRSSPRRFRRIAGAAHPGPGAVGRVCVYATVLDRTPRSYAFMLAGYTAGIMAFPIVNTPDIIFDTAVARCQEIILGILVMVVVSQVVFPQRVGGMLMGRLTAWLEDARRWTRDVVTERPPAPSGKRTGTG